MIIERKFVVERELAGKEEIQLPVHKFGVWLPARIMEKTLENKEEDILCSNGIEKSGQIKVALKLIFLRSETGLGGKKPLQ